MYNDVSDLDGALEHIAGLIDQVRGKLGDRFLRLELADRLAPKSTPFRVPSGLGRGIPLDLAGEVSPAERGVLGVGLPPEGYLRSLDNITYKTPRARIRPQDSR